MKHIVLTGGGTAGHVTPNIALIPKLQELGYQISYIGSRDGIEKKLIEDMDIPYYGISSGKLRRYLNLKNLSDTEGNQRSQKNSSGSESQYHLLQGRLCGRSRSIGSKKP